jgi:hypothetical protein
MHDTGENTGPPRGRQTTAQFVHRNAEGAARNNLEPGLAVPHYADLSRLDSRAWAESLLPCQIQDRVRGESFIVTGHG